MDGAALDELVGLEIKLHLLYSSVKTEEGSWDKSQQKIGACLLYHTNVCYVTQISGL